MFIPLQLRVQISISETFEFNQQYFDVLTWMMLKILRLSMLYKFKRVHMSLSSHSFKMTIQQSQIYIQRIFFYLQKHI